MRFQEDSRVVPNFPSMGGDAVVDGQAKELGGALEAFRNYLTMVARRGLAPDVAAKVGASDLVQETFLAAGRDIARFEGSSPAELRCWLKGILQHLLANTRRHYRGTRKRRVDREVPLVRREAGAHQDRVADISATATSPSGRAMRQEREDALRDGAGGPPRTLPAASSSGTTGNGCRSKRSPLGWASRRMPRGSSGDGHSFGCARR